MVGDITGGEGCVGESDADRTVVGDVAQKLALLNGPKLGPIQSALAAYACEVNKVMNASMSATVKDAVVRNAR